MSEETSAPEEAVDPTLPDLNVTEAPPNSDDEQAIGRLHEDYEKICSEVGKIIVGQRDVLEKLLICIFARGHALLMGVPGLAKTLMVHSLSEVMSLSFSRIQFTPDLMPSDITGTDILQETDQPGRRAFEFAKGPIFANIILADEINRTPPKTQAALLETMQEGQVTASGRTFTLDKPFFVLATQNPIEQEGTYPLPEAQLDRFMFLIQVEYPSKDEELEIAKTTTGEMQVELQEIISGEQILEFQKLVRRIPVPEHVYEYVVNLVRSTRPNEPESPDWVKNWVTWGAGPRAVQYLILGAKVHTVLHGSFMVQNTDVDAIAKDVLGHRIVLNFRAESEGLTTRDIVDRLVEGLRE